MKTEQFDEIVAGIADNYQAREICYNSVDRHFPSRGAIIEILKDLRRVMFPRYFGEEGATTARPD